MSLPVVPALEQITVKSAEDTASDHPDGRIRRHRHHLDGDPAFLIYEGRQCTIFGRPPIFGFFDGSQFISLSESVNYSTAERALYRAIVSVAAGGSPKMEPIGHCCVLDNEFARNLWHRLTECVPKAVMLEDFGFTGTYLIPSDLPFAADALTLLGIAPERVVEYIQEGLVADRLSFTQPLIGVNLAQYAALVARIRAAYLGLYDAPPAMRRLYLARRDARRVVNEEPLMALLDQHGFTRIYPEDFPLAQQIWMASNAEIVLGPHGAAMTLALFMPPNGLVVELFSPFRINPTMIELCALLGHHYHMFMPHFTKHDPLQYTSPDPYPYSEAIEAPLTAIARLLERWPYDRKSALPDPRNERYRAALKSHA